MEKDRSSLLYDAPGKSAREKDVAKTCKKGLTKVPGCSIIFEHPAGGPQNAKGLENLKSYQGDALNLQLEDSSFDLVLCFGPIYHLFNKKDKDRAI